MGVGPLIEFPVFSDGVYGNTGHRSEVETEKVIVTPCGELCAVVTHKGARRPNGFVYLSPLKAEETVWGCVSIDKYLSSTACKIPLNVSLKWVAVNLPRQFINHHLPPMAVYAFVCVRRTPTYPHFSLRHSGP